MASPSIIVGTPKSEVLNFIQRGENLKDAWYRICDAQNGSTRKQSTTGLLRNFYMGVTIWYRYVLDTISGVISWVVTLWMLLMLWEIWWDHHQS
jgi:hypothetical protein